jgi:hypothetical protein
MENVPRGNRRDILKRYMLLYDSRGLKKVNLFSKIFKNFNFCKINLTFRLERPKLKRKTNMDVLTFLSGIIIVHSSEPVLHNECLKPADIFYSLIKAINMTERSLCKTLVCQLTDEPYHLCINLKHKQTIF